MFSGVSDMTGRVNEVMALVLGISVFFLVLITTLLIFFVIKYNRKRNKNPQNIRGNTLLEITWTVIPTILVLVIFYYGWINYRYMRNAPKDALQVKVTGRMWSWLFEYPNGIQTDTLYVPYGKPVNLELHSQDVLHSFFVPAFRIKKDLVPGITNHVWFTPQELGTYDVFCAEYCGLQHAYMLSAVKVLPAEDFERWYKENKPAPVAAADTSAQASTEGNPRMGARLVQIKGCVACHSTDGTLKVSPSFKGLFGTETVVITNGKERTVTVDEEYVRRSMLEPGADLVKGFQNLMPSQKGLVTEKEIRDIIAYLKSLK